MKFALKIGSFFLKVIVGFKNEKGVIKNLKIFLNDNSKKYLGISLELLRAVWGQFSSRPCSILYFFSRSISPFQRS